MSLARQSMPRAVRWLQSASAKTPWTCRECQVKRSRIGDDIKHRTVWRRQFATTSRRHDEDMRRPITEASTPASTSTSLPSHTANQRSQTSVQMSKFIDGLLARASIASQHINAYTGTDYSGIEALRREIIDQERRVKDYLKTVDEAKATHHEAHAKQTSAQREIVGLLERKSSWSPADLERYMSLVRSEHLNDQDVQIARENLTVAERELEDSRSLLERLERKQYHEEQVWSDTIRRNSTWVTFGLMGVNILLLLAQIAIFEPYRRKKIVRDVKEALDEKTLTAAPAAVGEEKVISAIIPPKDVSPGQAESRSTQPLDDLVPAEQLAANVPLATSQALPSKPPEFVALASPTEKPSALDSAPKTTLEAYQETLLDLFSDRIVQLRKVDVTSMALQGAAFGATTIGILFLLMRPR